jgi:hypothetical protein
MRLFISGLFLCLGLMIITGSCKKSSSGANKPTNSYYVSSIKNYSPQSLVIDSFIYDGANRLTVYSQIDYDTTSGSPTYGEIDCYFSYSGTSPTPYGYTIGGNAEVHQLSYDGQNRISKDTATSTLSGQGYVTYYSYPANAIVSTVYFAGGFLDNQIDTNWISNGNISMEHIYFPNNAGTEDSLEAALQVGYISLLNPLYHAEIATTFGPILDNLTFDGFGGGYTSSVSANAPNKLSGLGLPGGLAISYTWTTDSKGRGATYTVTAPGLGAGSANIVFTYY